MQRFLFHILIFSFFTILTFAQTDAPKPILLDEFGKLNAEENFARIDLLAAELSKNEGSKAVIRIIGGSENCFLCHYRQGSYSTAILKSRKPNLEKYSIEYCNENEDLRVQLYLMPRGSALPPACNQNLSVPKRTVILETVYFYSVNKISPLENAYVESTGPADGEYSLKALKAVKNILDKEPASKIYIIAYRKKRKSRTKRLLQNAINEFVKNGIKPSQIKTIDAGYINGSKKLEFWFVPKGGEIPTPKSDY